MTEDEKKVDDFLNKYRPITCDKRAFRKQFRRASNAYQRLKEQKDLNDLSDMRDNIGVG